jgi:hypothetical protein
MYLYLKFHEPVLKIRVISSCRKWGFFKILEFAYKAMAFYAAENGIKECKNKVKTHNFKIFFVYTLCSWIICVKYKNWGITKISLVNDFDHVTANFLFLTKKS